MQAKHLAACSSPSGLDGGESGAAGEFPAASPVSQFVLQPAASLAAADGHDESRVFRRPRTPALRGSGSIGASAAGLAGACGGTLSHAFPLCAPACVRACLYGGGRRKMDCPAPASHWPHSSGHTPQDRPLERPHSRVGADQPLSTTHTLWRTPETSASAPTLGPTLSTRYLLLRGCNLREFPLEECDPHS